MKYIKTFESYSLNEGIPGGIGAIAGGLHKSSPATQQKASDKPDEFSCSVLVNPVFKKWGKYNVTIEDCKINKAEQKKGFFSKMFSGSSTIEFTLKSETLKKPIQMIMKLKGDKFVLAGDSGDESFEHGYIADEHVDKFIKYLLTQSKWNSELKEKFEDIEKLLTKESFE